jgi:hypothetical protein
MVKNHPTRRYEGWSCSKMSEEMPITREELNGIYESEPYPQGILISSLKAVSTTGAAAPRSSLRSGLCEGAGTLLGALSHRDGSHGRIKCGVQHRHVRPAFPGLKFALAPLPWAREMLDLVFASVILLTSIIVATMVWPMSSRSRWNPSGRVRVSLCPSSQSTPLTMVGSALLYHWRFKRSWPGTGHPSYEERCRRVDRCTERRKSQKGLSEN